MGEVILATQIAPSAPTPGYVGLYVDSADGKLKSIRVSRTKSPRLVASSQVKGYNEGAPAVASIFQGAGGGAGNLTPAFLLVEKLA